MYDHLYVFVSHFIAFLQPVLVSNGSLSPPPPNSVSLISGFENRVTVLRIRMLDGIYLFSTNGYGLRKCYF